MDNLYKNTKNDLIKMRKMLNGVDISTDFMKMYSDAGIYVHLYLKNIKNVADIFQLSCDEYEAKLDGFINDIVLESHEQISHDVPTFKIILYIRIRSWLAMAVTASTTSDRKIIKYIECEYIHRISDIINSFDDRWAQFIGTFKITYNKNVYNVTYTRGELHRKYICHVKYLQLVLALSLPGKSNISHLKTYPLNDRNVLKVIKQFYSGKESPNV